MFKNREGQRVPQVTFRARSESDWKPVTTDDIFKGKTVVVFSLPGAFTPTCSSTHVPRYNELAPAFFANGVDRIVCVSVNDAFVMNEWARTQECGNLLMVRHRVQRVHCLRLRKLGVDQARHVGVGHGVLAQHHVIYPRAVRWFLDGRVVIQNGVARVKGDDAQLVMAAD